MVGLTPGANLFLVVSQPRRFIADNDKEIEGLGSPVKKLSDPRTHKLALPLSCLYLRPS